MMQSRVELEGARAAESERPPEVLSVLSGERRLHDRDTDHDPRGGGGVRVFCAC